jgi:hypothetical protein
MQSLPNHVIEALNIGAQAPELLEGMEMLPTMLDAGYQPIETGYVRGQDGSIRVAVLTPMPGCTPEMWDWWFGWFGGDSLRFKLWHPRAHLFAAWEDGDVSGDGTNDWRTGQDRYVGRTVFVDEYIGSNLIEETIKFLPPEDLGLSAAALDGGGQQTAICARLGWSRHSLDVGYMVHNVRRTEMGCEMRSRYFIGGSLVEVMSTPGFIRQGASAISRLLLHPPPRMASELMVHCAQEMAHLASFLPDLYREVSPANGEG